MKRNMALVTLVLMLSMILVAGCAKRTVLQEEKGAPEQSAVTGGDAKPAAEAPRAAAEKRAVKGTEAVQETAKEATAEKTAKAAPEAAKEALAKAAKEAAPSKELYEFRDVNFDFDKFNLREDAREIIKKHAEWLNKNKDVMIVVEGHCDERGTTEYNLALGERRAQAAAKFLVDMGIDAKRIKTISYGEEMPLDPGHNEDAWAKNRRAHFVVSSKK